MKKIILGTLSGIFLSAPAFAFLPSSAITTLALPVYGIYTTSDPSCTTGLQATVALSKTPQTINFAANPAIGSGPVPSTIGCVVIVVGNSLSNAWTGGTYTTTSKTGGGSTYPDSNCNTAGTSNGQSICGSGGTPSAITWPAQISTDAAAVGLTLTTGTCNGTTSQIVPLVLSTNSICTGQAAADSAVAACNNNNINNFALPNGANDATHGTKLTSPSVAGNLKFIVNPTNTLGGTSNTGGCGNSAAPLFSFSAN